MNDNQLTNQEICMAGISNLKIEWNRRNQNMSELYNKCLEMSVTQEEVHQIR